MRSGVIPKKIGMTRLFLASHSGDPSDRFTSELQEPTITASAVVKKPKLIILDEPVSNLGTDKKLVLPLHEISDTTAQVNVSRSPIWTDHNVNDVGVTLQALFPKELELDLGVESESYGHAVAGAESDRLLGMTIHNPFVGEDGSDPLLDHRGKPQTDEHNVAELYEGRVGRDRRIESDATANIFLFADGFNIVRIVNLGVERDRLDVSEHLGVSSIDDLAIAQDRGNLGIQDRSGGRIDRSEPNVLSVVGHVFSVRSQF